MGNNSLVCLDLQQLAALFGRCPNKQDMDAKPCQAMPDITSSLL